MIVFYSRAISADKHTSADGKLALQAAAADRKHYTQFRVCVWSINAYVIASPAMISDVISIRIVEK